MSNYYEQSRTESTRGNRNTTSRRNISEKIFEKMASEKSREEAEKRRLEKMKIKGKGKYINQGSDDRVEGKPSQENEPQYMDDPQSYHYGYVNKGGIRVEAVVYALEKLEKYDQITAIGQRDYELGLTEEEIGIKADGKLEGLAKYPSYLKGYQFAKKKKERR